MNAKVRRRIAMGNVALIFCRSHPDESKGYRKAVARLAERLDRAEQLFIQQLEGKVQVHAAALRKVELCRTIRLAHLVHLKAAAQAASVELPELRQKFVFPRTARPFMAFRIAARALEAEAREHQELLERYGMALPVLEALGRDLAEFERASEAVNAGRTAHIAARAELEAIAREVVLIVKMMDGFNRGRFARDSEALAAWNSARKVMERADTTERTERTGETEPDHKTAA